MCFYDLIIYTGSHFNKLKGRLKGKKKLLILRLYSLLPNSVILLPLAHVVRRDVIFSPVRYGGVRGTPWPVVPGSFPGLWSHVLSGRGQGYLWPLIPGSFPGVWTHVLSGGRGGGQGHPWPPVP